jgi:hypothetical protein
MKNNHRLAYWTIALAGGAALSAGSWYFWPVGALAAGSQSEKPSAMTSRTHFVVNDRVVRPSESPDDSARADVTARQFDFGIVDPGRTHRHAFEVRNNGSAPLKLLKRSTTCKCLTVDIDPNTVDPGRTGKIIVTWEARPSDEDMDQRVTIETNDPANSTIELGLRGKTRMLLGANPAVLTASRIRPDEATQLETKIVSLAWDEFTLDVEPSLPDMTCKLDRLGSKELKELNAKSGWRLAVTLPPDLPMGNHQERVRLTATPAIEKIDRADPLATELAKPVEREILVLANVLGRMNVYGTDIDAQGTIQAGTMRLGAGYVGNFTVKVNDPEPQLGTVQIAAEPSFVEAHLEPYAGAGTAGLYRLTVRVPPSDVPSAYIGDDCGNITLLFDHPRIKKLKLGIEYIVLGSVQDRSQSNGVAAAGKP